MAVKLRITKPCAVLIDGSALFFASRSISDSLRLNYRALVKILRDRVDGLAEPNAGTKAIWSMWTSAAPDNPGQAAFLEFTERELHWQVRRFLPSQSFMIEPTSLIGVGGESGRTGRLVRFDAAIAFAIGRLAETHRIIVISDSFPLAEPLARVKENLSTATGSPVLAFFGRALEGRWHGALSQPHAPEFVNFDEYEADLFGIAKPEAPSITKQHDDLVF